MKLIFNFVMFKFFVLSLVLLNTPLNLVDSYFWSPNKNNTGMGGRISLRLISLVAHFGAKAVEAVGDSGLIPGGI